MKILGVIPARGGSKGIPRKNLAMLCGKSLLRHTAEAALKSKRLSRVILSTDDPEIADEGRKIGLDVPFMRPGTLAQDDTPTLPVAQHAVSFLEKQGQRYDAVCLLQPTSPFRTCEVIDACIGLFIRKKADSVITVLPVPHEYNPHWVYFERKDGTLSLSTKEVAPVPRRQLLPPAYHRDGSIYVVRRDVLMIKGSLYGSKIFGYRSDPSRSININLPEDLVKAKNILIVRSGK